MKQTFGTALSRVALNGLFVIEDKIKISVVIVNYNTREMTLECLRAAILALDGFRSEIIVVDNASIDGSVAAIRVCYPEVRIVVNKRNAGFGSANNLGMKIAKGETFLLLNSDAFPRRNAISLLSDFLASNPNAGIVGPRLLNADGTLQISCHAFPSPCYAWLENLGLSRGYSRWPHDALRRVDFVVGACMLVRRTVFENLGGFDERFFMYAEEADWQRRMRDSGWEVFFLPSAFVTHLGGASSASGNGDMNRHMFDSLDIYLRKHHGVLGLLSLRCAMLAGCMLRSIGWGLAMLRPDLRETARKKFRLHIQLLIRQATSWGILFRGR